jgi:hypothetical protein
MDRFIKETGSMGELKATEYSLLKEDSEKSKGTGTLVEQMAKVSKY